MNSNLSVDELYVFCLSCAVAQRVKSWPEGVVLRDGHEATMPKHIAFHRVGQPRVLLHLGHGSSLRKIGAMEKGDLREIKGGLLEVR